MVKIESNERFLSSVVDRTYFEESSEDFKKRYIDVYKKKLKSFLKHVGLESERELNKMFFYVSKLIEDYAEYVAYVVYSDSGIDYIFDGADTIEEIVSHRNYNDFVNMFEKDNSGVGSFLKICKFIMYDLSFGDRALAKECSESKVLKLLNKEQLSMYVIGVIGSIIEGYNNDEIVTKFRGGNYLDEIDEGFNYIYEIAIKDSKNLFDGVNKVPSNSYVNEFLETHNEKRLLGSLKEDDVLKFKKYVVEFGNKGSRKKDPVNYIMSGEYFEKNKLRFKKFYEYFTLRRFKEHAQKSGIDSVMVSRLVFSVRPLISYYSEEALKSFNVSLVEGKTYDELKNSDIMVSFMKMFRKSNEGYENFNNVLKHMNCLIGFGTPSLMVVCSKSLPLKLFNREILKNYSVDLTKQIIKEYDYEELVASGYKGDNNPKFDMFYGLFVADNSLFENVRKINTNNANIVKFLSSRFSKASESDVERFKKYLQETSVMKRLPFIQRPFNEVDIRRMNRLLSLVSEKVEKHPEVFVTVKAGVESLHGNRVLVFNVVHLNIKIYMSPSYVFVTAPGTSKLFYRRENVGSTLKPLINFLESKKDPVFNAFYTYFGEDIVKAFNLRNVIKDKAGNRL